mgnify:CR=1 FL=1
MSEQQTDDFSDCQDVEGEPSVQLFETIDDELQAIYAEPDFLAQLNMMEGWCVKYTTLDRKISIERVEAIFEAAS